MLTPIQELTKLEMEEGQRHTAPKVVSEVAQGDEGPVASAVAPAQPSGGPAAVAVPTPPAKKVNPVPAFLRKVEKDIEDVVEKLEEKA